MLKTALFGLSSPLGPLRGRCDVRATTRRPWAATRPCDVSGAPLRGAPLRCEPLRGAPLRGPCDVSRTSRYEAATSPPLGRYETLRRERCTTTRRAATRTLRCEPLRGAPLRGPCDVSRTRMRRHEALRGMSLRGPYDVSRYEARRYEDATT